MAIDMFLKVEGASGESKDSNHKGWTDITSFSGRFSTGQYGRWRRRWRRQSVLQRSARQRADRQVNPGLAETLLKRQTPDQD